jgi:hypothetical protein
MSDSIAKIAAALSAAQSKIEISIKDSEGHGYKYTSLPRCLKDVKIPFAENGLAITQFPSILDTGQPVLVSLLIHSSGEWFKSVFPIKPQNSKMTNEMQALGSGIAYLRRYTLSSMAGLAQEDDDAASTGERGGDKKIETKREDVKKIDIKREDIKKIETKKEDIKVIEDKRGEDNGNASKITPINLLMAMCEEEKIPVKEFANFHKISSSDPESVQKAIEFFDFYVVRFNEKQKT